MSKEKKPQVRGVDAYPKKIKPYLSDITKWKLDGVGNREIAKRLKVAYSTFKRHVQTHPELKEALSYGLDELKTTLERTYWNTAIYGTQSSRVVTRYAFDEDGNKRKIEETVHIQNNPPEVSKQTILMTSQFGDKYLEVKREAQNLIAIENANKYAEEILEKVSGIIDDKAKDPLDILEEELNEE